VNKSIYDKIIDKGSQDALEIINLGKQKAEAIENEIISEANLEAENILKRNQKTNQDKLKAHKTQLERMSKREILFKKKELIDQLFLVALERLQNLKDEELFKYVLEHIKLERLTGNEIVRVNKTDYSRYLSVFSTEKPSDLVTLDKLNKELGSGYNLKLSKQPVEINGGFILESENYDIDLSFVSVLNIIKESNETELANILFNEEN